MKTDRKNLRRISIVVTAQTKGNLERLATVCGYSEIGRVVDKLVREKMISLHNYGKEVYNSDLVESVVAETLLHGNKVVINADW